MATFIKALFFVVVAEMGDKTQLMTIAISADSHQPILILMGTTVGMLIADGIGILGGAWMGKHIPKIYIKWGAGIIFMFFGTLTLYNVIPSWLINPIYIMLYFSILGILIYIIGVKFAYNGRESDLVLTNKDDLQGNNK